MPISSQLYYFTQDTITRYAPRSPGVYALYDEAQSLIYYGMSETSIEARLQSHFDGYEGRCTQDGRDRYGANEPTVAAGIGEEESRHCNRA